MGVGGWQFNFRGFDFEVVEEDGGEDHAGYAHDQFADDQGKVSEDADDHAKGQRFRILANEWQWSDDFSQAVGDVTAAHGACDEADEGDADLHGREKAIG